MYQEVVRELRRITQVVHVRSMLADIIPGLPDDQRMQLVVRVGINKIGSPQRRLHRHRQRHQKGLPLLEYHGGRLRIGLHVPVLLRSPLRIAGTWRIDPASHHDDRGRSKDTGVATFQEGKVCQGTDRGDYRTAVDAPSEEFKSILDRSGGWSDRLRPPVGTVTDRPHPAIVSTGNVCTCCNRDHAGIGTIEHVASAPCPSSGIIGNGGHPHELDPGPPKNQCQSAEVVDVRGDVGVDVNSHGRSGKDQTVGCRDAST